MLWVACFMRAIKSKRDSASNAGITTNQAAVITEVHTASSAGSAGDLAGMWLLMRDR
jgi:branched-subunit amino acid ABC-type transport system permease component